MLPYSALLFDQAPAAAFLLLGLALAVAGARERRDGRLFFSTHRGFFIVSPILVMAGYGFGRVRRGCGSRLGARE